MLENAIITGGTGGIGTALTKTFVDASYNVFATHNNKSEKWLNDWLEANDLNKKQVKFINCDLTNKEQVEAVFGSLLDDYNFSVLINNAGVTADSQFSKMSYSQWERVIDVNLKSLFSLTQIVTKQMIERASGSIVSISSVNGLKGQFGQTNYSATKAGIIGFTKSLALELARHGINVNAIAPGYTRTPMVENMRPEILEKIVATVPLKRLVEPEEVARTALFLCSGIQSITGETISVNGGLYLN